MLKDNETQFLSTLVEQKRDTLRRLLLLGQQQRELVRAGDMTSLLELLSVKQRAMSQLQRTENLLRPFQGQDASQRAWASAKARQHCAELLAECATLLQAIVEQERDSEAALVSIRDRIAAELRQIHRAEQAAQAYVEPLMTPISIVDLSTE